MPLSTAASFFAILLLSSVAERSAPSPKRGAEIPLTDGIMSFSELSDFSWQTWQQRFSPNLKKFATHVFPNGDIDFLASNDTPSLGSMGSVIAFEQVLQSLQPEAPFAAGTPLFHLRIQQYLKADQTERTIGFNVTNYSNRSLIQFLFHTTGHDLEKLPETDLSQGLLPFFPTRPGELQVETRIEVLGLQRVTSTVRRETQGDLNYLEAFLRQGDQDTLFMMYREWSSPIQRRIYYHYTREFTGNPEDNDWAAGTTLEVRKIKRLDDKYGTEYFWVDGTQVGLSKYQDQFNASILQPLTGGWQNGFGQIAMFIFTPGFLPSFEPYFQR